MTMHWNINLISAVLKTSKITLQTLRSGIHPYVNLEYGQTCPTISYNSSKHHTD